MKRKLVPMMLAGALLLSAAPAQAVTLPMFKQQESDTVTISREEYESYQRYQKLEMLLQLVETYYYEDVDEDAMLENAAVGLMAGIGDIYSVYYTKEEMEKFNEETEGQYAGIGCQLLADLPAAAAELPPQRDNLMPHELPLLSASPFLLL